jgi:hypothetical protein
MVTKANASAGLGITLDAMPSVPDGTNPNRPATGVSWKEAAVFVNYLNQSQGYQPAYNIDSNGNLQLWSNSQAWRPLGQNDFENGIRVNLFRHQDAAFWLPSVDEWYKAAYYDPNKGSEGGYWKYATGSDSVPTPVKEGTLSGTAVHSFDQGVGPAFIDNAGGLSPLGTMAQNGNVWEWMAELTFVPDEDGIIPVLDSEWFKDDIVARTHDFLRVTFGDATLNENLKFIEKSLGKDGKPKSLREYFTGDFYKDHCQTYKKRPIYWLFSSGKLRAFQCLVYLHRYNEGTLARMRTEYVIPLQGQIAARIDQLEGDKAKATSTSHRTKIQKEQDKLKKQQVELATFEEKLKHYADMRISLDLDDGVKVNYAKFGDLLAESKAIAGGKDDE